MGSFKDFYDILKDLISHAKMAKNQELVDLSLELQQMYFDLREDNENMNERIKELNEKIKIIEASKILEKDIEYSPRGFFTLKTDNPKIPYCSCCWKKEHKTIPLSQSGSWFNYKCGNCKSSVVVMDKDGQSINKQ